MSTVNQKPDETAVRTALAEIGLVPDAAGLAPDDDLFALGLTSLQVVQLVVVLEEVLGTEIPDDRISVQDFRSVNQILAMLAERDG
ncbi:phosphopantetheine-binding protein [Streptomyces sp. R44]|uniref:Phosphopantetheine-binding protein n=1 Tax=Streptomyces sp. R44 TaxID=3238633 RepID=A0AB39T6X9_9ACTN